MWCSSPLKTSLCYALSWDVMREVWHEQWDEKKKGNSRVIIRKVFKQPVTVLPTPRKHEAKPEAIMYNSKSWKILWKTAVSQEEKQCSECPVRLCRLCCRDSSVSWWVNPVGSSPTSHSARCCVPPSCWFPSLGWPNETWSLFAKSYAKKFAKWALQKNRILKRIK